jgi:UDP-N-acetyl-D-mannosaminuronic acid dehydrogenase
MKIAVFGLGYVGLPAAVTFASKGLQVVGVDVIEEKVKAVNSGHCYLKEPKVCRLLQSVVKEGLMKATTNGVNAVSESDAVIVAVPTPVRRGSVDLSYLRGALDVIRKGIHRGLLIVIESTIPPGTTVKFVKPFLEESGLRVEEDFYLAHVPERIAPGKSVEELLSVPRIVGGVGPMSTRRAIELYSKVNSNLFPADATTAEFVKLIENTFRDLNIAYANLLALIAEKLTVDVYEAIRLANTHPRVSIHWPGSGVGGPCLTKDPYMLVQSGKDVFGIDLLLLARKINDYMPLHTVELVKNALKENNVDIKNSKITVLGAAYKGGVDDTRESPARIIVKELIGLGANVTVYDPYTEESFGASRAESLEEAITGSDAVVIVTDHPEFKRLDLDKMRRLMRHRIIVDGRRVVEPYEAVKRGFRYYGIGFGKVIRI